jgi:hypothetical protein
MSELVPQVACFLVEWYSTDLGDEGLEQIAATLGDSVAELCGQGIPVRLLNMLSVPTDEVLFGVFAADSAPVVARACEGAGLPAQRVTAAVDARIA